MPTHTTYQPTPPPKYPHMRPQVIINQYGRPPYQAMAATNLQHPPIPPFSQRSHHPYHTGNSNIQNQRHNAMHEQIPTYNNNSKRTKQQQKVHNKQKPIHKPPQSDYSIDIGTPTTANIQNQHSTTTINRDEQQDEQNFETNKHSTEQHFRGKQSLDSGLADQNANITIGTLNIQNIKGYSVYLQTVLKSLDILCIQEHWILSLEKDIIKKISIVVE
ncbi:unnamed protein product [Mytilus coruscus]|uniref:Endonuclease/exonuclease/phosphatase domain-containing protein n=1 Tax=Mytilus coruscus TaxID=42192 RepID=A0A6J8CKD7_MYTCO|nr:unnamed protein product [Mytilus coruscus]